MSLCCLTVFTGRLQDKNHSRNRPRLSHVRSIQYLHAWLLKRLSCTFFQLSVISALMVFSQASYRLTCHKRVTVFRIQNKTTSDPGCLNLHRPISNFTCSLQIPKRVNALQSAWFRSMPTGCCLQINLPIANFTQQSWSLHHCIGKILEGNTQVSDVTPWQFLS